MAEWSLPDQLVFSTVSHYATNVQFSNCSSEGGVSSVEEGEEEVESAGMDLLGHGVEEMATRAWDPWACDERQSTESGEVVGDEVDDNVNQLGRECGVRHHRRRWPGRKKDGDGPTPSCRRVGHAN